MDYGRQADARESDECDDVAPNARIAGAKGGGEREAVRVSVEGTSWWSRLWHSRCERLIERLEKENDALRRDNAALLDRVLARSGVAPLAVDIAGGPRAVPRSKPVHAWRRNADTEAKAWGEFNAMFSDSSVEDLIKEKNAR
jgi:hypothetical protein